MAKEFAKALYNSSTWRTRIRPAVLARCRYICETPGCFNPAEEVDHIIELTPENIYSINAISATLEAIGGVKISGGGVNCDIAVNREENKNAVAETDVLYKYSVSKNGEEKNYSAFVKLMKQLNGSSIIRWNVKQPTGKPYLTITLSFFDSSKYKPEKIRFYQYSQREYAVVREGLPVNTVSATWVKQFLNDVDEF